MLYRCISKQYNKSGRIEHYNIMDENGTIISIGANEIKDKLRKNEIHVENLSLTKDNKIRTKGDICNELYHYTNYCKIYERVNISSLSRIICTHLNMVSTKYGTLNVKINNTHRQIECILNNSKFDGIALLIQISGDRDRDIVFLTIRHLTSMKSIKKGYALELPVRPTLEVNVDFRDLEAGLAIVKDIIDNEVKAIEKGINTSYKRLMLGV